jgi:hypothetical protein
MSKSSLIIRTLMKYLCLLILSIFVIMLYSCSTAPISINGDSEKLKKSKSIAILEFMILPEGSTDFNYDTDEIDKEAKIFYEEMIENNTKECDTFEFHLAHRLKEYTNTKVHHGLGFHLSDRYKAFIEEAKIYPKVYYSDQKNPFAISGCSSNLIDFGADCEENSDNDWDSDAFEAQMKKAADMLNVDLIVFCIVQVQFISNSHLNGLNPYTIYGRENYVELIVYDKKGEIIIRASSRSELVCDDVRGDRPKLSYVYMSDDSALVNQYNSQNYFGAMNAYYDNMDNLLKELFAKNR